MANSRTLYDFLFLSIYQKLKCIWICSSVCQIPTYFIKINKRMSLISIQKTENYLSVEENKNLVKSSQFIWFQKAGKCLLMTTERIYKEILISLSDTQNTVIAVGKFNGSIPLYFFLLRFIMSTAHIAYF